MSILYKSLQANQLFIRSSLPIVYFLIFLSICFLSFRLPLLVIPSLFSTDGCFTKFTSCSSSSFISSSCMAPCSSFQGEGLEGGVHGMGKRGTNKTQQTGFQARVWTKLEKCGLSKNMICKWMNGGIWHCIWITFHLLTQLRSQTQVCVPLVGRNKQ